MKRLHVHVAVHDIQQSVCFYSALFAAPPTVTKEDYAKWMLDDPRVNFAISSALIYVSDRLIWQIWGAILLGAAAGFCINFFSARRQLHGP